MFKKILICGSIAVLAAVLAGGGVYFWKQGVIKKITNDCLLKNDRALQSLAGESAKEQNEILVLNEKNRELEIAKQNLEFKAGQAEALKNTLSKYQNSLFSDLVINNDSQVGKKFGALVLKNVGFFSDELGLVDSRSCNIKASFSGKVTVSGSYTYYGDTGGELSDIVCFNNLDFESELKMPRLNVENNVSFCFSNDFAKEKFSPADSTGTATVVIDNFSLECYPAGIIGNQANLVEVLEKSK